MGVTVANWLIWKIVGVERYNDRMMKVDIVIGDVAWELVFCYCPQAGRAINENEESYELMDWWVVTLMAMLVVIWIVLERFMGVLGFGI